MYNLISNIMFGVCNFCYAIKLYRVCRVRKETDPDNLDKICELYGSNDVFRPPVDEENDIRTSLNIPKNINIRYTNISDGCSLPNTIIMNKNIYENDKNLSLVISRHEYAHIKNKDHVYSLLTPLVASLGFFAVCLKTKRIPIKASSSANAAFFSTYVALGTEFGYGKHMEARADNDAIRNASIEELFAFRRYFIAHLGYMLRVRESTIYPGLVITRNGGVLYDIHPSYGSRSQKIENELKSRGISDIKDHEMAKKYVVLDRNGKYDTTE